MTTQPGKLGTPARAALAMILLGACAPATAQDESPGAVEDAVSADHCPVANGVRHGGRSRFMSGVNYPWEAFGADFGGLAAWGDAGVAATASVHAARLADIRAHGGDVVRWWIFPDLRGDGVALDDAGDPTGLGGTAVADVKEALALAEEADVHLMFTIFSFDAFRPGQDVGGVYRPGIAPLLKDPARRNRLVDKVVRPLAKAVASSPHRGRLVAWDVINEPEWAMAGPSPYGDPAYTPMSGLTTVSHAQMEGFLSAAVSALHAESSALVTLGSAGMKWGHAWTHLGVDFYQVHWYDWLEADWPHERTPQEYGLTDRPVVVGEFPVEGMAGSSLRQLSEKWYAKGYAGAMGWAYDQMSPQELGEMKTFAGEHRCETSYSNNHGGDGKACSDTPPDESYTCAEQASWGKCGASWMAGRCDKSCGRCG